MPTAPTVVCEGDACALERPAGDAKDPESGTDAAASNDVIVYSRWSCSLCWITKWALWWHGVRYVTRSIDYDRSWEDAIDRSGFTGGCRAVGLASMSTTNVMLCGISGRWWRSTPWGVWFCRAQHWPGASGSMS